MRGKHLAQECHIASALAPVDITGGKTGRFMSLRKNEHITFIIPVGVSAAAFTKILVNAATDSAGTGSTAIAFDLYAAETTTVDKTTAKQRVAAAGFTPSANDDIFYVIEIDAADVVAQAGETFEHVTVQLTNGVNSVIAAVIAIGSGGRYQFDQSPTINA